MFHVGGKKKYSEKSLKKISTDIFQNDISAKIIKGIKENIYSYFRFSCSVCAQ